MNKKILVTSLLSIATLLTVCSTTSLAIPANPNFIEVEQPDGTQVKIKVRGDEFFNWFEDEKGNVVIQNSDNYWTYAKKDESGNIVASDNILGVKISKTSSKVQYTQEEIQKLTQTDLKRDFESCLKRRETDNLSNVQFTSASSSISKVSIKKAVDTKTNFVLLIQFKDYKFSGTEAEVRAKFNDLFNKENYTLDGAKGSVFDYFKEVSYGKLNYKSVISPIVTIDASYLDYAYKNGDTSYTKVRNMIKEALKQLDDSGYDFSAIWPEGTKTPEGFTVIHAGGGAENGNNNFIWSHSWTLTGAASTRTFDGIKFLDYHIEPAGRGYNGNSGLVRIGVICHESLHFFGVPDLYDTTYNSNGIGKFCVMSLGTWNGDNGTIPAHPCAWIKYKLGWSNPQTVSEGENVIQSSATHDDGFYKISPSNFSSKEYFLIENRQSYGFDSALPGSNRGLLIYHIDESKSNNDNKSHYLVDIEEADGAEHLVAKNNTGSDGDYFRNGTNTTFSDTSYPNSKSYSGTNSEINIFNVSASGSVMYFYAPEQESLENFANNLTTNGYNFVKLVSKITTSQTALSSATTTVKKQIAKYFSITTSGGKSASEMAELYYKYIEDQTVYGIPSNRMATVTYTQAKVIQNLNSVLEKCTSNSNIKIESIGNISAENESPLKEDVTGIITAKRFTGVSLLKQIDEYNNGLGCLMYDISRMENGIDYGIIEVIEDMDTSDYYEYVFVRGIKAASYNDLSQIVAYPNPSRKGYMNIINLPTYATDVKIEIYTSSGQFVRKYTEDDIEEVGLGKRKIRWDCKNESGQDVAPGVYIALLQANSSKKKIKIAVIR